MPRRLVWQGMGNNAKVLQNNYDMGPSIARSDSFDVQHYDLTLDVTAYNQQAMSAMP